MKPPCLIQTLLTHRPRRFGRECALLDSEEQRQRCIFDLRCIDADSGTACSEAFSPVFAKG